jgi:hypothetical protein
VDWRALIGGADFDPDTLAVVSAAFDNAWAEVAPHVNGQPAAIECARTTLADFILGLARNGTRDVQALTDGAVRAMLNLPSKL